MQKIEVRFVIEAQDPYDDKVLELVKAIKGKGGEIMSAGAQRQPPQVQQRVQLPSVPTNMRTGEPV